MIIRQYEAVIRKLKTETRRTSEKDTYKVGHDYAVVPKRAWPTVYYKWLENDDLWIWHENTGKPNKPTDIDVFKTYTPLRVLILSKHWEPLHAIDEAGAIAEGITVYERTLATNEPVAYTYDGAMHGFATAIDAYRHLWESINGKTVYRWDNNPQVCVHKFKDVQP